MTCNDAKAYINWSIIFIKLIKIFF